jgi:site-specific recombinase XerD
VARIVGAGNAVTRILDFVGAAPGSLRYNKLNENTWKQYKTGLARWVDFAKSKGKDILEPEVDDLAECISFYHGRGVTPSALNVMATAVSTVFSWKTNVRLGKMEQIVSLLKGAERINKTVRRERQYFDPEIMLRAIEERDWEEEDLEGKLMKVASLLILCYAMRFTEMESIKKNEVLVEEGGRSVQFRITMKESQGVRTKVKISAIDERKELCVVKAILAVMEKAEADSEGLFAFRDKHGMIKELNDTHISKLVRRMMTLAGVDESITPYTCKHVGLSKAWQDGASEGEITDAARWAPGSKMFRAHYKVLSSANKVSRLIMGIEKNKNENR